MKNVYIASLPTERMAEFQPPHAQCDTPVRKRNLCLLLASIGSLFILSTLVLVDPYASSDHVRIFNAHVVYATGCNDAYLKADRVERFGAMSHARLQCTQQWWQGVGPTAFRDELDCEDARLFFWKGQTCWTCQAPTRCFPFSSHICAVSMQMRCNGTHRTQLYSKGLQLQTNEKNWMPFEGLKGELFMVYSVAPYLTVLHCDPPQPCEIVFRSTQPYDHAIRGGSAGLEIAKGHHLFMGHVLSSDGLYQAVLLEIKEGPMITFELSRLSSPFTLMHVDGFVYPHGIGFADAEHQNVLISMGINDNERWVAQVPLRLMLQNDEAELRAAIRTTARQLL